jgi:amino acid transporter
MSDFSVLCSRNYLPFENRSNNMDTASLKSKVLWLITFIVDSFSLDTLVPAFLPETLTFSFLKLPTAVPFYYVKTFTYHQIF